MENKARDNEPSHDDESPKLNDSEKQRVSAAIRQTLDAWLWRRQQPEQQGLFADAHENEEDDDDESETGTKKKVRRFRAALKSFFGAHVEKPNLATEQTQASMPPEQAAESASDTRPLETSEVESAQTEVPQTAQYERPLDPVVAVQYEQRQRQARQVAEKEPGNATEATEAEATAEQPAEQPTDTRETPAPLAQTTGAEWVILDRSRTEQATERPEVTRKDLKEVTDTDYYRNRKRKRDIKRTDEKVRKLQKQQRRTTEQLQKHTEVVASLQDRKAPTPITQYEQRPIIVPTPAERMQVPPASSIERSPALTPEAPKPKQPEREPASVKEILAQRAQTAEQRKAEQLARARYETIQAQTVQERVEKAAEQNIAIEAAYERRHEVKDDNFGQSQSGNQGGGSPMQTGGGVPVVPLAPVNVPTQTQQRAPKSDKNPLNYLAPQYRQAARNGFWGAIVILVLAAMAFLFI